MMALLLEALGEAIFSLSLSDSSFLLFEH